MSWGGIVCGRGQRGARCVYVSAVCRCVVCCSSLAVGCVTKYRIYYTSWLCLVWDGHIAAVASAVDCAARTELVVQTEALSL